MHDLLALMDMPLLAASPLAALAAIWSSVWPYLVMAAGFSVIVFVHELGHFLVAKWAGVRVDRFAIGFGRELFGVTWGQTRYSFNILPLGGYVKMLGQEDFDDKSEELKFKDDPDSFVSKPVGHRMAIVSAGVVMNILFACFLFMFVFLEGKEGSAPRIALVEPDSPAEQAGLAPGDLIREINGSRILTFEEVSMAVMLSPPHEPIEFMVERDGGVRETLRVRPENRRPEGTRRGSRLMVGIGPGVTRRIVAVGPQTDASRSDHPHFGDVIVEVGGVEVTDANVNQLLKTLAYTRNDVVVERKDADNPDAPPRLVTIDIPPLLTLYPSNPGDRSTISVLGLSPLARFAGVDPRGRAALAGIEEGDTLLRFDDVPNPSSVIVARATRASAERDIPFTVLKPDGRRISGFVRPKRNPSGSATIMVRCVPLRKEDQTPGGAKARFVDVRPFGIAQKAGIRSGELIVRCDELVNPTNTAVVKRIHDSAKHALSFTLRRSDGSEYTTSVRPVPPGSIDAAYGVIAEDVLLTGNIVPEIDGHPSPAAAAGIPSGVRILRVDGETVSTWTQLIDAFRVRAGSSLQLTYRAAAGGETTVSFAVPPCLRTVLGIGPEGRIVSIDGQKKADYETQKGTKRVAVRYHAGTHAALRKLIGKKDVPVEFRRSALAPVETKRIDVTEEMIDPWLARVAYQPNVALAPETTIVKGENAIDAILIGVHQTYYFILNVYETLNRMIFTRSVGVENISGPLGIVSLGGKVARMGLISTLFFMAVISANLAVINFLPLPIVDGGLMVFLIIEKIKGSPVSLRVQVATQMIGLALIVGAFVFVTYQDALRLWG